MIKHLLRLVGRANYIRILLLIIGMTIQAVIELLLVSMIPLVTSIILIDNEQDKKQDLLGLDLSIESVLIFMLIIAFVRFIIAYWYKKRSARFFSELFAQLVSDLNLGYLKLEYLTYKKNNINVSLKKTLTSTRLSVFYVERILDTVRASILAIILITASAAYDIASLLIVGVITAIVSVVIWKNKAPQFISGEITNKSFEKIQTLIQESFKSFKELKFNNGLLNYQKNINHNLNHYSRNLSRLNTMPGLPAIFLESFVYISIVLCFGYWFLILKNSSVQILPGLIFYLFVFRKLLPAFNEMIQYYLDAKGHLSYVEEVNEQRRVLNTREEINQSDPEQQVIEQLSFHHLQFSYEEGEPILEDINLNIKRGDRLAVVGRSGAGKSTLTEILASILEPTSGEIYLNQRKITTLKTYRNLIGYVPQTFYVFDGTIEENILMGNPEVDRIRLEKVLKVSMVEEFMVKNKLTLKTQLGDQANKLSGGQKQRIALARGLYHEPDMLILDEATSALDADIEQQVLISLFEEFPETTILMVTHRRHLLSMFDQVISLESGRISEYNKSV